MRCMSTWQRRGVKLAAILTKNGHGERGSVYVRTEISGNFGYGLINLFRYHCWGHCLDSNNCDSGGGANVKEEI